MNRVWQHHFGRGIVRSTSDFGFQGTKPTHPKLLDWLATEFMARSWDLKAMHKFLMTSDAYKRSSAPNDEAFVKDPLNNRLWRFDMRRLTAEEVRDSVLAARGNINFKMGGPVSPRPSLKWYSPPPHDPVRLRRPPPRNPTAAAST